MIKYDLALNLSLLVFLLVFTSGAVALAEDDWDQRGIRGSVSDESGHLSEVEWRALEAWADLPVSESPLARLVDILKPAPRVATVYGCAHGATHTVTSGTDGGFQFSHLPQAAYTVFARTPASVTPEGGRPLISALKRVRAVEHDGCVRLGLYPELVTVQGRVVNTEGEAIAGATVTGWPSPFPEAEDFGYASITTLTDVEGRWALSGFEPVSDLRRIAGYLNGGSLTTPTDYFTCVEIVVTADGYLQPRKEVPTIPLVTAAYLPDGRRLLELMRKQYETMGSDVVIGEKEGVFLPASEGNVIMTADVVMVEAESE